MKYINVNIKERKNTQTRSKNSKNQQIKIDREEILDYNEEKLPDDAIFKGYEEVIIQDIKLVTDNIKFRKKKYYSPSRKKNLFDAPQFKLLTEELSLCWVHEGRHYKKLNPLIGYHQKILTKFLDDFGDYYRKLLKYREYPNEEMARKLKSEFEEIFSGVSGYEELDGRKELTRGKMKELLLVLEHPELPLHNNLAELAARTMVRRRHISYGTQTELGTKAWDTFMSLVDTTRKLGISFFEYVADRISEARKIPPLATIIEEKSSLHFWGESWQV